MADAFDDPNGDVPTALPRGFRTAVQEVLAAHGYQIVRWESDGVYICPAGSDEEQYIGLNNLYRRARNIPRDEWPPLIAEFLEHVHSVSNGPELPDHLDTITAQLRPRIGPPFEKDLRLPPWSTPLPGTPLVLSLVIDFPHAMAYATEAMVDNSQLSAEELLACALDNLRQDTPEDFFEPVSPPLGLLLGHTSDGYDASRALLAEELVPDQPAGLFVAVPSRDELYVWPVGAEAMRHLLPFQQFVSENYRRHAYPISDQIFWVYQQKWHPFPIRLEGDTVHVYPPEEFLACITAAGLGEF